MSRKAPGIRQVNQPVYSLWDLPHFRVYLPLEKYIASAGRLNRLSGCKDGPVRRPLGAVLVRKYAGDRPFALYLYKWLGLAVLLPRPVM